MSLKKNVFKIILFGDSNVGKTTLVKKLVSDKFNEKTTKTIGVEFRSKIRYIDNLAVTLQIWDFSGEERFNFLLEMYCKGVVGGIFVFDMTNNESMLNLNKWISKVRSYTYVDFPILIVGTKQDLVIRKIAEEKEYSKKDDKDSSDFFTCSAKTGENVDLIFQTLAERIYSIQKEKAD